MKKNHAFYLVLSIFIMLILWHLAISLLGLNRTLFPSPVDVALSFGEYKLLIPDLTSSILRLFFGCAIGIASGSLYGIITGHVSSLNNTAGQITNFFRFIPPLALMPLFMIWFGIGEFPKIALIAWASFLPAWISTHNGVRNIEGKYLLVAKSLELGKYDFFKQILLNGSIKYILNGARIAVGLSFSVLVAAEMMGAYSGLGSRLLFFHDIYRVDLMIGYIMILGLIGIIFDRSVLVISNKLTPWCNDE
jgi:ABC-type nitrate/sulfonate/bicarbonate transport system permease component